MSKLAVILLLSLLFGNNMLIVPQVLEKNSVYTIESQRQSTPNPDETQTENLPSAEVEDRHEESAILTRPSNPLAENHTLHFVTYTDKPLVGMLPDLVIPPKA